MTTDMGAATEATGFAEIVAREGHRTIGMLDRSGVRRIRRLLRAFDLARDHPFFASPAHAFGPRARQFDRAARATLVPAIERILPDHEIFMVAVTSKGRRRGADVKFHHDWTYTDERRHRAVFFWVPLVDVGRANGTLRVVPGSQRWTSAIRPSRASEATEAFQAEFADHAVDVEIRAGEAVAFDPALIHGSWPNRSGRARPAITVATVPREAGLVHFHEGPEGHLLGVRVDQSFFTDHPYGAPPADEPSLEPWDRAVTEDDFRRVLGRADRRS